MRVVGGIHRGRKIKSPRGRTTRPTPDMVREALFNILNLKVVHCNFLDIFAGTGAVGLEALSRGANYAAFIEKDRTACKIITENLESLDLLGKADVLCFNATEGMKKLEKKDKSFDIIFLDPPYYKNEVDPCLEYLRNSGILKPDSIIVVQHPWDISIRHDGFICVKQKKYGKTILSFLIKEEKT
ncbi:MAG TPA: 16S rRNA (guanine(966)-N(2))-methyltransferase RsmD [Thermoanaerobacterales bacterium]|nr:16S rRNA (guanine(966)-N(2))-methyltransferase RsmD [Thermoanaerobacterales bacterium]